MTTVPVAIEACVVSAPQAAAASRAGATRLELCRDLDVGGVSPHPRTLAAVRRRSTLPLCVMVRPRPGTFVMTAAEVERMIREIDRMSAGEGGVDGIVLGVLDRRDDVDAAALLELVAAADGIPVTFHRAFDEVRDRLRSLEVLIDCGVRRVLTSGGAATAWEGRAELRELVSAARGRIAILGAGSVRGSTVRALLEETGLEEVHARASAIPGIVGAVRALR